MHHYSALEARHRARQTHLLTVSALLRFTRCDAAVWTAVLPDDDMFCQGLVARTPGVIRLSLQHVPTLRAELNWQGRRNCRLPAATTTNYLLIAAFECGAAVVNKL